MDYLKSVFWTRQSEQEHYVKALLILPDGSWETIENRFLARPRPKTREQIRAYFADTLGYTDTTPSMVHQTEYGCDIWFVNGNAKEGSSSSHIAQLLIKRDALPSHMLVLGAAAISQYTDYPDGLVERVINNNATYLNACCVHPTAGMVYKISPKRFAASSTEIVKAYYVGDLGYPPEVDPIYTDDVQCGVRTWSVHKSKGFHLLLFGGDDVDLEAYAREKYFPEPEPEDEPTLELPTPEEAEPMKLDITPILPQPAEKEDNSNSEYSHSSSSEDKSMHTFLVQKTSKLHPMVSLYAEDTQHPVDVDVDDEQPPRKRRKKMLRVPSLPKGWYADPNTKRRK